VEHILVILVINVLVIKMLLRVITHSNDFTSVSLIFPLTSSKVEHIGLVIKMSG